MIRKTLIEKASGSRAPTDFRRRGGEITRIEGLSDAVLALSVTLLIVSLEVPKTFTELMTAMRGFFAFAICFALLIPGLTIFHGIMGRRRRQLEARFAE
jgi:uncharacterized membrane protein